MAKHGKTWKNMEKHGKTWKNLEKLGKPWKKMENMENMENKVQVSTGMGRTYQNQYFSTKQRDYLRERLLEEALARLDVANFVRSDTAYGICEIIGLTMKC